MTHRPGRADWIGLLALTAMWGSAFLLTKVALTGLAPNLVVAGRLIVACVVLAPLALLFARGMMGGAGGMRLWVFLALIALFGNALPFSLIAWGQQRIDSGLAGILMAVMPLATLGLAHYFVPGERLTWHRIGGFTAGFSGVVVLMAPDALAARPGAGGASSGLLLPMAAVLAGAFCYAVSAILARLRPPSHPLPSAAITTLMAAGMMLPFLAASSGPAELEVPGWGALAAVIALGLFSTAWASVIYFGLIRRAGPAFVSQLNYLIPLWAVGAGMLFLGEQPQGSHLIALALILGGILLTHRERRSPRTAPAGAPGAARGRSG